MQVCSEVMPSNSIILGMDLVPILPIPNVKTHICDITTEEARTLLRKDLQVHLCLHLFVRVMCLLYGRVCVFPPYPPSQLPNVDHTGEGRDGEGSCAKGED